MPYPRKTIRHVYVMFQKKSPLNRTNKKNNKLK